MVQVVNLVGGGEIGAEVNLAQLHSDVDEVTTEYNSERHWQLVLRFPEKDSVVILYRTGKYIIRCGSSYEELCEAKDAFAGLLSRRGITNGSDIATFDLQNIVCTDDLGVSLDLNAVCLQLGLEHTEYEPEQFPGLVYRPSDIEAVVLIFGTGKVIVTGLTEESEAELAIESLQEMLQI